MPTYLTTLSAFTHFLTAYIHTLLYLRSLYPRTSFLTSRFHNTPIQQSRHPTVCDWIRDAASAVSDELIKGTVARIAIVIYCFNTKRGTGSVQIMERYMMDVSQFPLVPKNERNTEIEWDSDSSIRSGDVVPRSRKGKGKAKALDADVETNLSEAFRAALTMLNTRCSRLSPLPPNCSFNVSMELKDEAEVDPPIGHPQAWIPVQPSLQKTGRKGSWEEQHGTLEEGEDLGGARVTPIRTVEAGVFKFETWIEEGKAKFEMEESEAGTPKSSFVSSFG